jgi:hypothetical protein
LNILKSLKLTNAQPTLANNDPVVRARGKVVEALAEQKAMVVAKLAGQHYASTRVVWRKNDVGERVQVEAQKRLRAGWFIDATGQTYFALRYAGRQIEFAKDRNAIVVEELAALPTVLDKLIEAVRTGELDSQLADAAAARGHLLRKKA